jgi:aldehyde:ferredoxin oxidoreductase
MSYDLEAFRRAYWRSIGWDEESGVPTEQTLEALDLQEVVRAGKEAVLQ